MSPGAAVRRDGGAWLGGVRLAVLLTPALAGGRRAAAHGHDGGLASRPLVLILAMAALSLIPFALLMVTSFVRISVVLSILRSAIGTPSVPPTQVLTGLALVLTHRGHGADRRADVRAPRPALGMAAGADLTSVETVGALVTAADRAKEPLRDFLLKHTEPARSGVFLRADAQDAHARRTRGGERPRLRRASSPPSSPPSCGGRSRSAS